MQIELIAAFNNKRAIGYKGGLPWPSLKQDMALFKRLTTGGTVIMGRKTWASLPAKIRPLPDRFNIVISNMPNFTPPGAVRALSVLDALLVWVGLGYDQEGSAFIIGGERVYREALEIEGSLRVDVMHLSLVDDDHEGDVFFPEFDQGQWREVERTPYDGFTYVKLVRR